MGLLQQHPEANPLFKEGRNVPYITLDTGPVYDQLVTQGFLREVLVPLEGSPRTVLVHGVPTYVSVNCLVTPPGFLSLKRRFVGLEARPQLLGSVQGDIPDEVWICDVGRKRVTPYRHEPDLCHHCSRWGHKDWKCRSLPRCRFCAGRHLSEECRKRIQDGASIPPRCCNCGGPHNAHSRACPVKPAPFFSPLREQSDPYTHQTVPPAAYRPAPPPAHNAWETPLPSSGPRQPSAGTVSESSPVPAVPAGGPLVSASAADLSSSILLSLQKEIANLSVVLAQVSVRLAAVEARPATPAPCPPPGHYQSINHF
ncbi:uncharacterized protein LOC127004613 isoform X1 [Eriocheir sinensis]|uniref:uncharacterized protein LOC127004613 isoform X1 n=1 Tax=Eriocheir sinensis TaxID=95602 RepID=UPI0021C8B3A7|nr:uncharacterized protein LOC127004613 isoform X1 [Eriocheir sinensis]